jgi:serine/threonine protein kinase
VLGLGFLHEKGVINQYLGREDILVDSDGHLRLTHFGYKGPLPSNSTGRIQCEEYRAPELLMDNLNTKAADWWTLGNLMYEMLCGIPPFYDENTNNLVGMIIKEKVKYPDYISPNARDLIDQLMEKDPLKRLGGGDGD